TLPIIKNVNGFKGKGANKLETLVENLGIEAGQAHNAINDVIMLEKILDKLNVPKSSVVNVCLKWSDAVKKQIFNEKLHTVMKSLDFIKECTSYNIRKKMIEADITSNMICDAYKYNGLEGLKSLLGKNENNVVLVTKSSK
ncbi:hypothetical protein PV326_000979, partial [Microctonus aethiopoides]